MSTLVSILRAVHCRSTHHFFAIDALDRIDTPNGRRLSSVLLANYREYLRGAKDPDTKFKDFQNHVVHVSENNWGGAPKACETWLARAIEDMHNSDWKSAAYSIGVLSHYFTDPLMPLHTAQHPSEGVVHRPLEWSVCKSYDWIFRRCSNRVSFPLEVGAGWISKAVLAGAAIAHKHYVPLIEFYDLKRGVQDPRSGLDSRSRAILTEIFDYALTGWAGILDRIAALAIVEIPICPLTFTTVMAAVDVPSAWVIGRITDASEQRAVKAIFDEYQSTGTVFENLSPEIRVVASAKPVPASKRPTQATKTDPPESVLQPRPSVQDEIIDLCPVQEMATVRNQTVHESFPPKPESVEFKPNPVSELSEEAAAGPPDKPIERELVELEDCPRAQTSPTSLPDVRGLRVTLDSNIVDAPSIGPKTADRFYEIGIASIRQFLAASATEIVNLLNAKWPDERTLIEWQDQARLVVQVSALCGYKAQLLVGSGCRTVEELARCDVDLLHSAIGQYCATAAGARIIRSAAVPSREEVAKWKESALMQVTIQHAA